MVLEDGTSSMSSMFPDSRDSSKYNVDLVSSETDIQMLSPTAITAVINPIQFIEEEMDDVYVSEVDTPFKDVFLHNYYKEATDSTVCTMEEASDQMEEDIFKVWILDMPDEEDEFMKMLALSEETQSALPEFSNDDSELLDNLAVGVADLSLNRHS